MPNLKVSLLPRHFAVEHFHCNRVLRPVELLKYGSSQDTLKLMAGWDHPDEDPVGLHAASMAAAEVIQYCHHLVSPYRAAVRLEEPKGLRPSDALAAATLQLISQVCDDPKAPVGGPKHLDRWDAMVALAARISHLALVVKATEASGFVAFGEIGLAAYALSETLPWRAGLVEFVDDRLQALLESI